MLQFIYFFYILTQFANGITNILFLTYFPWTTHKPTIFNTSKTPQSASKALPSPKPLASSNLKIRTTYSIDQQTSTTASIFI